MALDLGSLQQALDMMKQVHARAEDVDFMRQQDDITRLAIHAGVIQHFEIAYELCWKFIGRWVRLNVPSSDAEQPRTRKELFRIAARSGLLDDPLPWFDYGNARNRTSHTYNLSTAEEVYNLTGSFIKDADALLKQLEKLND